MRLLADISGWLHEGAGLGATSKLHPLRGAIEALAQPAQGACPWVRALRISLVVRLQEALDRWQACVHLRGRIDQALARGTVPRLAARPLGGDAFHRDAGMAALSGLTASVAVLLCCTFWIGTAWPTGSAAAMVTAVLCSFFATMDDPAPAIRGFLKYTLWSVPLAALYVLALLPMVQDIASFAWVCAPALLINGAYIARPATMSKALPFFFGVVSALALHDTASANLAGFINATMAQVLGMLVAASTTELMRSIRANWSARRIQRANWRDLEMLAVAPGTRARERACAVRMLDRIGLLGPRLAQAGGTVEGVASTDALHDLRLGVDVAALRKACRQRLPEATGLLKELARWFRAHRAGTTNAEQGRRLLLRIDGMLGSALTTADRGNSGMARQAIAALVGLRRNLFPDAPPLPMPETREAAP